MTSDADEAVTARRLLAELWACTSFESAAKQALRQILAIAEAGLRASAFARLGRMRRVLVHLRPAGAYRQLASLEAGGELVVASGMDRNLFSATAWRWVAEHGGPVSLDVNLASVCLNPEGGPVTASARLPVEREGASLETRARFLQRDVSHVLALPLRTPGRTVAGMICIEADCRAAMGTPFIWPDCVERLQFLTDVAAPHLAGLPAAAPSKPEADEFLPVIGRSMATIVEMLALFARQSEPILIQGPTGVGKSRLARWCHQRSPLHDRPFEVLDLSAVPEELQLAELFGWRRGAFTGAVRDNSGVIGRAHAGTLFIDEIHNLSQRAQAGLLHVLEEKRYRVLGDGGPEREADVRFIIGTNQDLHRAVNDKRFREDLYYRINVLPVMLPPLAERADEIPLWAEVMLNRQRRQGGQAAPACISREGHATLTAQRWPGNLRQLDNIIKRASALAALSHAGAGDAPVTLGDEYIRRAIAYDTPAPEGGAAEALLGAANACLDQARRRPAQAPMDLDVLDGFKGVVLAVATEKAGGDRDGAFALFGREKLVSARNHHKVFRRELARAQQLFAALAGEAPFPFARLLSDGGDSAATAAASPGAPPDDQPV